MRKGGTGHAILPGRAELDRLYWRESLTSDRIGARFGVSGAAVRRALARAGIPRRLGVRQPPLECVEGCGRYATCSSRTTHPAVHGTRCRPCALVRKAAALRSQRRRRLSARPVFQR